MTLRGDAQLIGLYVLAGLGFAILVLLGYTFWLGASHITADGKVPVGDAATFTGLILAFREVLAVIRSLWESADRQQLTDKLGDSAPVDSRKPTDPPPRNAIEGADQAADAARGVADDLREEQPA